MRIGWRRTCSPATARVPAVAGRLELGRQHEQKTRLLGQRRRETFFATLELELILKCDWHTHDEARRVNLPVYRNV
jgi:hypothetical protein